MPTRITLHVGGKRTDILRAVEAKAIVARFTQELARHPDQVAHVFDLSCRSWTKEAIDIIAPFLEQHGATVSCANLDDIIAGRMTDEGLAVTERLAEAFANSKLIEVSMNDNAMGPRGLSRINLLFNSPLQRLYFSNCGLSEESMKMLKDAVLGNDGRIAKSLTDLVLDKNMIGKEGAKLVGDFLKSCKKLQYFSYAGCRPEREGSKAICEGIHALTQDNASVRLRHLNLDDCTIGDSEDDAVQPLSEALAKCPQLRYLNLRSGDLEIGGLEMLVGGLQASGAQLTHLDLESNGEFGSEGARILTDFLYTQSTSIQYLNVESNELGDEGVCILMEAFTAARNCLEELNLNMNEIEVKGAETLVRAILPKLKVLRLEENEEMPKKYLRAKYGDIVKLGEDEDDDDEEEADDGMDSLIFQLASAGL